MASCIRKVGLPSLAPAAAAFMGRARQLASRETAHSVNAFLSSRWGKDSFKFWARLSDFMNHAGIRATYWPSLPNITVWTKRYDYFDVFASKYPRFKTALSDANRQKAVTRHLVNQSLDFGGGVLRLSARWLPVGSLASRLSLPVTAATALVFSREQLGFQVPAIRKKEETFTLEVAQEYLSRAQTEDKKALFQEITGAYNARAAQLLVHDLQGSEIPPELVQHIRDHLKKERFTKVSDGAHSLLSGSILTYAAIAGMGVFTSGALLALMFTPYVAAHLIDQRTSITRFSGIKQL